MCTHGNLHNRYRGSPIGLSVTATNVTEICYQSLSVTVIAVTESLKLSSLLARASRLIYRVFQGILGQFIYDGIIEINAKDAA